MGIFHGIGGVGIGCFHGEENRRQLHHNVLKFQRNSGDKARRFAP